jgi:hypothetical protein
MTTESTPVTQPPSPITPSPAGWRPDSGRLIAGFLIIGFGVLLLVARTTNPDWLDRSGWWPLFVIGLGAAHLAMGGRLSSGFMFVLIGGWGLLNEFGIWNNESSWPVVFVIVGLSIMLGAFVNQSDAARAELRDRRKGRGELRVLAAFMIFGLIVSATHGRARYIGVREDSDSTNVLRRSAVLGQSRTVSYAETFQGARMTALMGECDLDLTHAGIREGDTPTVRINVTMGQARLRVPQDWTVENEITPIMGDVSDARRMSESADVPVGSTSKRVIVRGSVIMGELMITN